MNLKYLKNLWRGAFVFLLPLMLAFPKGTPVVLAAPGDITRVSVDSSGLQANAITYSGQISANGGFVAFDSDASNLVAADTNGFTDVFLRNLQLGTTVRVSLDALGGQANSGSGTPSVSMDGHFVAFESNASNLVAGDTNNFIDIFVKDTQTGSITRVSVSQFAGQSNGNSSYASISGDGRYVTFISEANNLVINDGNGVGDIFVHDRQTGITFWASVNGNASSWDPSISLDGRFVAFSSGATNLVNGDANGKTDVFVYAVLTGTITRASVSSSGAEGNQASLDSSISGDGRYVSFSSASTNFMTGDTFGLAYAYVHDMQSGGVTSLVSSKDGVPMLGTSDATVISADGRYIAFSFDDKGDGQAIRWTYIYERATNQSHVAASGGSSDGAANPILASISSDGRFLAFASSSALIVSGDTNGVRDIFVKEVSYPVDLSPSVISVMHGCPNGCGGSADQLIDFLVKFSEPVSGVDAGDFVLTSGLGIVGAVISTVSGAGSDYIVRVDTGTADGTLRLDVIDDDSIKDFSLNLLGGVGAGNGGFAAGEVYTVDKNILVVTSIVRVDPSPSASGVVHFVVNFSEPVTGVGINDFLLAVTGTISNAAVMDVNGAENTYLVTASTGTGDGTLRLDLIDNDRILDILSVPLGGFGIGNGSFTLGETYTVDRSAPIALSIVRTDANPTAAATVHFNVTFSKPVSGVDGSDFLLSASGVSGAFITEVLASGNAYLVTVNNGTGNGAIRLDVVDNDSIIDATGNPLGGAGWANGNFGIGETYTITKIAYITVNEKVRSSGANDGWILESWENSNQGYYKDSRDSFFNIGDDSSDRQYRSILSFPTSYLPDDAVVTNIILLMKLRRSVGLDPFNTHGNISIDIRYGSFGSFGPIGIKNLQASDFQAQASMNSVGQIQNNPVGGWYWAALDRSTYSYINLIGVTQFRLAFQLDDNDDLDSDFLMFYSGDFWKQTDRPHLLIEYKIPRWK